MQNNNMPGSGQPSGAQFTGIPPSEAGEKRRRRKKKNIFLRFIMWTVIVVAVLFLTLFLSARIGQFDSIGDMIGWIMSQIA